LSEAILSSGAGDPLSELSCDWGGDGRLMCVIWRIFGNVVKTLLEKESRSSGGGVGVRADPSEEIGEQSREEGGREESSLSVSMAAAGGAVRRRDKKAERRKMRARSERDDGARC